MTPPLSKGRLFPKVILHSNSFRLATNVDPLAYVDHKGSLGLAGLVNACNETLLKELLERSHLKTHSVLCHYPTRVLLKAIAYNQ